LCELFSFFFCFFGYQFSACSCLLFWCTFKASILTSKKI
jgi:hypothetical protein